MPPLLRWLASIGHSFTRGGAYAKDYPMGALAGPDSSSWPTLAQAGEEAVELGAGVFGQHPRGDRHTVIERRRAHDVEHRAGGAGAQVRYGVDEPANPR